MAQQENHEGVTAIVPAYNEGARIGVVLKVLATYPRFKEVIVVDDGSTDDTEAVARSFDVTYVKSEENRGKGRSMDRGVRLSKTDTLFFCDADVIGLTHAAIDEMVHPVLSGEVDMFIGMRNRKWYVAHQVLAFVPLLGGERALKKSLWEILPEYYKQGFRTEAALNYYALHFGNGFRFKIFRGLGQVIKERKYGLIQGTRQRWGMMYDVFLAQYKLRFTNVPDSFKKRRLLALVSLQSVVGLMVSAFFFAAVYYGPNSFVHAVFAAELKRDPSAPFVNALLHFTNIFDAGTIAAIGFSVFVVSAAVFLLTFDKMRYLYAGFLYKLRSNQSR